MNIEYKFEDEDDVLDISMLKLLSGGDPIIGRTLFPEPKSMNYLTLLSIENKVPKSTKSEEPCNVCYNTMDTSVSLSCLHKFCSNCVNDFKKYNITKCPMCRADIDNFDVNDIAAVMFHGNCTQKTAIETLKKYNGSVLEAILMCN